MATRIGAIRPTFQVASHTSSAKRGTAPSHSPYSARLAPKRGTRTQTWMAAKRVVDTAVAPGTSSDT